MLQLKISNERMLELEFDEHERFSECCVYFKNEHGKVLLGEDFLYVFPESMLGRINNIPVLPNEKNFGDMGKWQECYYFDDPFNQTYRDEIERMEKATFFSLELYVCFLYKYKGRIWIELDKCYSEGLGVSVEAYYSDNANYRIMFDEISDKTLEEWKKELNVIWNHVKI